MGKYKRAKYRYWLFPFCSDYYTFEGVTFLCASDDMTTKKPQAILDLEKAYNIEIPDLSSQEGISWSVNRYFKQDSSGAVVELCLRECQIESMTWLIDFPALKKLDLSYNQISKLEGLERLTSLTKLRLRSNQIRKLEGLDSLTSLTKLSLSDNQISKLEGLERLTSLAELYLLDNQISKLEGLERLTSLTELYLSGNQISKLEGLERLTSLTKLRLRSNQISKLEGLDSLTSLTKLSLSDNQISKLEGLERLTSLAELYLLDNQIRKLEGLERLTSLATLELSGNQIRKLEGLERLTSLATLELSGNQIRKLEGLERLTSLTKLRLRSNQISKLEGLDSLTSLTKLSLSDNQISKLEGLERLTSLAELYLLDNQISKLEGLERLTSLATLELSGNQIRKLEGLERLTSLTKLRLRSNQISKLEGLERLTSLATLELSGNQIRKLEGLERLTSLATLELSGNQISKLEGLERLSSLTKLRLRSNQISKLEGLERLTSLTKLSLSDNQISKLEGLERLTSLAELYLLDNQIRKLEGLERLTSLTKLRLRSNQISKLEGLDSLTSLTKLSLSDNQISKLEGLERLTSLAELYLLDNQIRKLEGLDGLASLTRLSLRRNQISKLEGLDRLKVLRKLDVSGNDIQSIDDIKLLAPILEQTLEKLRIHDNPFVASSGLILSPYDNHLPEIKALLEKEKEKQKKTSVEYHPFCKVMLLGNHSSGKTTFLSQYDTNYTYQKNTHVLSIHRSNNPNAIFYDFGGQDYYHGIYQAFFTTQSLYLLFWDAKKDRNFVSVDDKEYQTLNFNRPYWLGQIAYACNRCMSVGGNPDGKDTPQTTDDTIIIQTHADETGAKQQTLGCAAENGVLEEIYVSLEPKANSAVHALNYLNERVREVVASRSKSIQITEKDKGLYEALPTIAGDNKHIPISLEALAAQLNKGRAENDLYTIEYLQTELNQLSLRGEVLYYRENEKLNNYVWLDPAAFVQMIHGEILQKDNINRGTVPKDIFECKLHNLSSGSIFEEDGQNGNMILQLLLEELIVYEDKDCYVIPGYLPLHSDDEAYKWLTLGFERPNFVLKFERFIPFGLINQIIAYYGREEGALKRYWRDQVIFTAGREMDRQTLEQEEEKEGLPKTNAEDYQIWIKLDFTDLAISVFIKEQRKTSAKDMQRKEATILSDMLDMYWNNIPPREQIGDKDTEQTRSTIRETNRKKRPIQDLYLSCAQADKDLTESHYIHLGTLDDESKTTARIAAYPLKNGVIDKERVREVSTRPYKHLSVNKNLATAKQIFISYSKEDQTELETCLQFFKPLEKNGQIEIYYDKLTKFETPIHPEIRKRIVEADCIIALISQRYLATDYILDHELPVFREYNKTIVPILIKPCTFEDDEFLREKYFAQKAQIINLGKEGKTIKAYDSITASAHRDENWVAVVREFKEKILRITKQEVNTDE
ncbi:Leucine Rich Repeat (LRR)-containing protein [Porphyromonas gingivalis]|uniref:leucine-rich repeat protein n=1 Tax=Porphyromonas gingivalis TaxID=837 RepID=UPI0006A30620|nr:leucine-rich repeat protein [Porphyromonas gingivalis]AKV64918.1 Leucine Rich Repeat (LRR)-containing protein [Porphyromonas gingivalis]